MRPTGKGEKRTSRFSLSLQSEDWVPFTVNTFAGVQTAKSKGVDFILHTAYRVKNRKIFQKG